jgi:hypothetical protein
MTKALILATTPPSRDAAGDRRLAGHLPQPDRDARTLPRRSVQIDPILNAFPRSRQYRCGRTPAR